MDISQQFNNNRQSAIQRLRNALEQDFKLKHHRESASQELMDQLNTDSEDEMKNSIAPQVAGKVAARFRHAEERIQKAEDLAFSFANEVETLRLQLEKEELINAENKICESKMRDYQQQVVKLTEEKSYLEREVERYKTDLDAVKKEHSMLRDSNLTERSKLQSELNRLAVEKQIADDTVQELTQRVKNAEAALQEQREKGKSSIDENQQKLQMEKSSLIAAQQEWERLVAHREEEIEKVSSMTKQIVELNRLVKTAECATKDAEVARERLKEELDTTTSRKVGLEQRLQGLEDELRVTKRSLDLAIEQRNQAEAKVDTLKSKLRHAKKKATREAEERQSVEALVENLRQVASSTSTSATETAAKLARKEEQVLDLKNRVKELKSSNDALQNQRTQLTSRLDRARSDLSLVRSQEHSVVQGAKQAVAQFSEMTRNPTFSVSGHAYSDINSSSGGEVESLQRELAALKDAKLELERRNARADVETKILQEKMLFEERRSRHQEKRIESLRAQLSALQQMNSEQVDQSKVSLRAKEAESEFVWRKLEEALNKDGQLV